jgi:C-terminal peptidase prc
MVRQMKNTMVGGLVLVLAALPASCVTPTAGRAPSVVAPQQDRESNEPSLRNTVRSGPARAASCPLPPRQDGGYDLAQLPLFSKTLFYVRENYPQDIDPRARDLLVAALEAVALEDNAVAVERDPDSPPRWVTVTVDELHCTLNIEQVDAPWSLRSTLQQALRFVQGHLGREHAAYPAQKLMRIEIAATNGMLSALDRGSRLLDAETYRTIRMQLRSRPDLTRADAGAIDPPEPTNARRTVAAATSTAVSHTAQGRTVGYLRLSAFPPGVGGDVEHELAGFEADRVKGLVLDLRDNTGGLLDEATKVADAFIKAGTIGWTVGKHQRAEAAAHDSGHEPSGALVVLVNRRTAAASEFVAAAIKNLGRGVILGEATAGAGSIRVFFDIRKSPPRRVPPDVVEDVLQGAKPTPLQPPPPDDEPLGLLLTTGRLLAAGGAEIEGVGVLPDIDSPCPIGEQLRAGEDCLLQLAQGVVAQAPDAQRPTLVSTAKALAGPAARPLTAPPQP